MKKGQIKTISIILAAIILVGIATTLITCAISNDKKDDDSINDTSEYTSKFTNFITRNNDKLQEGGKMYKFVSTNITNSINIEGPSWLSSSCLREITKYEQEDIIKTVANFEGRVARIYPLPVYGVQNTKNVYMISPDGINKMGFESLDMLLALANKHGVRIIIPLIDKYDYHGGIKQFSQIYGGDGTDFYTNRDVIDGFKDYIKYILYRENTITGVKYRDDKAILAWETGNELDAPDEWIKEISGHIKSIDRNHLIMDGNWYDTRYENGFSEASLKSPNIDIMTNHYYLHDNKTTFNDYLTRFIKDAEQTKGRKPMIIGEYGVTDFQICKELLDATDQYNNVAGSLLWSISGRSVDGGFIHTNFETYSELGSLEADIVSYIRKKSHQVQGLDYKIKKPEPPVLLPSESPYEIVYYGSIGSDSYTLMRSESFSDGYKEIQKDIVEGMGSDYTPLSDDTAEFGKTYFYKLVAQNKSGTAESEPLKIKVKSQYNMADLQRQLTEAENMLTLPQSGNETSNLLNNAVQNAKAIIKDQGSLTDNGEITVNMQIGKAVRDLIIAKRVHEETTKTATNLLYYDDFWDEYMSKATNVTFSRSSNVWYQDHGRTFIFKTQKHRAVRNNSQSGFIMYKTDEDIKKAVISYYVDPKDEKADPQYEFVNVYISKDGNNFEPANMQIEQYYEGLMWNNKVCTVDVANSGYKYIKIEFSNPEHLNYSGSPVIDEVLVLGS